jgi:hypothetical protein
MEIKENECTKYYSRNSYPCVAEVKIYSEIQNPSWAMKKSMANRLLRLSKRLPCYYRGIPDISERGYKGCVLTNSEGFTIHCCNGLLVIYEKNVIEFKEDKNCFIENEILRSAPEEIYKEISYFL